MPERWQSELRKLRAIEPSPSVWERARRGPIGDGERPLRHRFVAGAVAFAVFAAAGVLAWNALRPRGEERSLGDAAGPIVTVTFHASDPEHPDVPVAVIEYEGRERAVSALAWEDRAIQDFLVVPAGARLAIEGDADAVSGFIGGPEFPWERVRPLTATGEDSLDLPPGRYALVFEATFGDEGDQGFAIGIEIVDRGAGPTNGAVLSVVGDPPNASLTFGDQGQEGTRIEYCWQDVCGSGLLAGPPEELIRLPAGTAIALIGDWRSLTAYYEPIDGGRRIALKDTHLLDGDLAWDVPGATGTYELWVSAAWTQGSATFRFGVEILLEGEAAEEPPPASDVLRVVCGDDGARVAAPVVAARADGVHVTVESEAGAVALEFHRRGGRSGSAFGGPVGRGPAVWPIDPGRFEVACLEGVGQSYADVPTAAFEVVDPHGYWTDFVPDCGDDATRGFAAYDGGAAEYVDDASAIRAVLLGLRPDDQIRVPGYVEGSGTKDGRLVIVRDGRVVAHAFVGLSDADDPSGAGLTEVTGEACGESGVAEIGEADAERLECAGMTPERFPALRGPRVLPGGEAYINANLQGMRVDDEVRQISFRPDEEWEGVWGVTRDGRLVALVTYPSLDGIACDGSGIGGA